MRHFGPGGGDVNYSLSGAEKPRDLLEGAGFAGMTTERVVRMVRFPSSERFVRLTVLGSAAVLPDFEQMDEVARDGLVEVIRQEFAETLAGYLEGDAVEFPLEAHIATARM